MSKSKHRSHNWVALCAALVIALQSLFTVWAAASPLGPALDAFGNPLCLGSAGIAEQSPDEDRSRLPKCCTFGCSMAAPVLPVPDGEIAEIARSDFATEARFFFERQVIHRAPDYDPGNPRAPPLTA